MNDIEEEEKKEETKDTAEVKELQVEVEEEKVQKEEPKKANDNLLDIEHMQNMLSLL